MCYVLAVLGAVMAMVVIVAVSVLGVIVCEAIDKRFGDRGMKVYGACLLVCVVILCSIKIMGDICK